MSSKRIKTFYLIFFTLLSVFSYSQGKEYNIAAIRVEGPKTLNPALVTSLSGLKVGDKIAIPSHQAANAIRLLWKQGLFSNIDIQAERYQGDNVYLVIKVEEKPRVSRYKITGIKKGEIDDLRPKLELRSGMIFNNHLEANIRNIIRNFYKEKGFIHPDIKIYKTIDTVLPNSVSLEVKIDRGYRYKISHIYFINNKVASGSALRKSMPENKQQAQVDIKQMLKFKQNLDNPGWTWYDYLGNFTPSNTFKYLREFITPNVFNGAKYKPEELRQTDIPALKQYYHSIGYRDVKVVDDTVIEGARHSVSLYLKLDEGKRYYFRNIDWIGNTKYNDDILSEVLDIRKGDVYNSQKLMMKLNQSPDGSDVAALYMDDGYLYFNVEPIEVAIDGDSVDLLMRVHEGTQATINRITISGNEKTNEKVIRRELLLRPGDKFNRSTLMRTQRELAAKGFFDPEKTQILPKPNQDGTVDIDLVVAEKPNDQLSLSLGYAQSVYGQVGLNFTNFSLRNMFNFKRWTPLPSGDGQTLGINIQSSGVQSQLFNVSFTEPWLGGRKPISLTVTGTHSRVNNTQTTPTGTYLRNVLSAELGMRLKWPDDYFVAFIGGTMENSILKNYTVFPNIRDGNINNLYARFTLRRNDLNGPLGPGIYPTSGSDINFTVQATLPYSLMFESRKLDYSGEISNSERWNWIEYHKWKFSTDMYVPIYKNLVARMIVRMGTLGYYNKAYGLSPFEQFRIGGDGLVGWNQFGQETYALRGYGDNEVMVDENGQPFQSSVTMSKYVFELRYPIMLNPQSSIYGMLFAEAGNGWQSFKDFQPFNVKKAYGAGVRFFLPMFGLLGFDYGLGVDKRVPINVSNGSIFEKYGRFRFILSYEPQ